MYLESEKWFFSYLLYKFALQGYVPFILCNLTSWVAELISCLNFFIYKCLCLHFICMFTFSYIWVFFHTASCGQQTVFHINSKPFYILVFRQNLILSVSPYLPNEFLFVLHNFSKVALSYDFIIHKWRGNYMKTSIKLKLLSYSLACISRY